MMPRQLSPVNNQKNMLFKGTKQAALDFYSIESKDAGKRNRGSDRGVSAGRQAAQTAGYKYTSTHTYRY